MKAMILAAGRGARMRPLTDNIPKPLLTIGEKPLIVHLLNSLVDMGISDVVINVCHLGEKIQLALGDGSDYGIKIHYSVESELLETGGGINHVLPLLGTEPFLVISADIFTHYPLKQLPKILPNALAHLVLVPNPDFHPTGDYAFKDDNNHGILTLHGGNKFTYASFGVFHPELFHQFRPNTEKFRLTSVLIPAIEQGLITGECYHGFWHNLGTYEQLVELRKLYEQ